MEYMEIYKRSLDEFSNITSNISVIRELESLMLEAVMIWHASNKTENALQIRNDLMEVHLRSIRKIGQILNNIPPEELRVLKYKKKDSK